MIQKVRVERLGTSPSYAPNVRRSVASQPSLINCLENGKICDAIFVKYHETYFLAYDIYMLAYRHKQKNCLYHKHNIYFKLIYLLTFINFFETKLKLQFPT